MSHCMIIAIKFNNTGAQAGSWFALALARRNLTGLASGQSHDKRWGRDAAVNRSEGSLTHVEGLPHCNCPRVIVRPQIHYVT